MIFIKHSISVYMGQTISNSWIWNTPISDPDADAVQIATPMDGIEFVIELSGAASMPLRAPGSAGYVVTSAEGVNLKPGERKLVRTGIHICMDDVQRRLFPPDTVVFGEVKGVFDLAQNGIDVFNEVFNSDTRGELKVLICNNSAIELDLEIGYHVATLIFGVAFTPKLVDCKSADKTETVSENEPEEV